MCRTASGVGVPRAALPALAALALVTLALAPSDASAQRTTRRPARRAQTIEIRGQVPTPQVVTVRPRETPSFSRQVLVPQFYDHDFWPAIVPGYQIVSRNILTGAPPGDSTAALAPRPGATPGGTPAPTGAPPAGQSSPADTTRRPPAPPGAGAGTPPAR